MLVEEPLEVVGKFNGKYLPSDIRYDAKVLEGLSDWEREDLLKRAMSELRKEREKLSLQD